MPAPRLRRFAKPHPVALAAAGGYIVALIIALAAWQILDARRGATAMARFGTALAADLAHLAADPLLRQDRIRLGLLLNRLAERAEVRGIAIDLADGRPFVVTGSPSAPNAPTYRHPIVIQDTIAGGVRLTLNASHFQLPGWRMLAKSWPFWLVGLALTVAGFQYGTRLYHATATSLRRAGRPQAPPPAARAGGPGREYLLVANLFRRATMTATERAAAMDLGLAAAKRVASLYAGRAVTLPTGVLVLFEDTDFADRGFEVACAALLMRRLCENITSRRQDHPAPDTGPAPGLFRYGLGLAAGEITAATGARATVLLSSLAPDGEIVIDAAAHATVQHPERLRLDEFNNPATAALDATVSVAGILSNATGDHQALLTLQAELVARALDHGVAPS